MVNISLAILFHQHLLNSLKTKNVLRQQNKDFQKKMTTFLHSIQQKCQF